MYSRDVNLLQVLPPSMVTLAEPRVDALVTALTTALHLVQQEDQHRPQQRHAAVAAMYSWDDVAQR